jgi:hypothetical protein
MTNIFPEALLMVSELPSNTRGTREMRGVALMETSKV